MLKWISVWLRAEMMTLTVCRHLLSCLKWKPWCIFSSMNSTIWTHGPRAPHQCKHNVDIIQTYKIYKYIQNIYVSFDKLQCFCYSDALVLYLWVFLLCPVSQNQIWLALYIQISLSQKTVLNPSTASQVEKRISDQLSIATEAHNNKGLPGGYQQSKQTLLVGLK